MFESIEFSMLPSDLDFLFRTYTAANPAHKRYRENFLWLNGACFLLHTGKEKILQFLRETIETNEKDDADRGYTIGEVTAGGKTWMQGIHVSKPELHLMADDFGGFLALVQRQTVVGAHRTSVDFCFDLLSDLIDCSAIHLDEKTVQKIKDRSISPKGLTDLFQKRLALPITENEKTHRQLHLLSIVRNLLEHNNGRVDEDFIRVSQIPELKSGDPLPIQSQLAGHALGCIDNVVTSLNKRAIRRWPILVDPAWQLRNNVSPTINDPLLVGGVTTQYGYIVRPSDEKPLPTCDAFFLCRNVKLNKDRNAYDIETVFNQFNFTKFPAYSFESFVYIELQGGIGTYQMQLEFRNAETMEPISGTYDRPYEFKGKPPLATYISNIPSLFFARAGIYELIIFADGRAVHRRLIHAAIERPHKSDSERSLS